MEIENTKSVVKENGDTKVYQPSPFWKELAAKGSHQLKQYGFKNFKRTVNMKYFNWNILGIVRHQLLPVFANWLAQPDRSVFSAKFNNYKDSVYPDIKSFNVVSAIVYKLYVAMLFNYVAKLDALGLLSRLNEPLVGNPFVISFKGVATSQDICNSVHELYQSGGMVAADGRAWNVLEIGAGYGRVGDVFLRALPNATYCIVDIQPALSLSQEYLSVLFPKEQIFHYRDFNCYEDIRVEFEACRIRFLSASQIALLPPKHFDQIINISSLHEMTFEQIDNYFKEIDRICRGTFYTKQWRVSRAQTNGFTIKEGEYPIPSNWRCRYHNRHPIQQMFFEALYELPPR